MEIPLIKIMIYNSKKPIKRIKNINNNNLLFIRVYEKPKIKI